VVYLSLSSPAKNSNQVKKIGKGQNHYTTGGKGSSPPKRPAITHWTAIRRASFGRPCGLKGVTERGHGPLEKLWKTGSHLAS